MKFKWILYLVPIHWLLKPQFSKCCSNIIGNIAKVAVLFWRNLQRQPSMSQAYTKYCFVGLCPVGGNKNKCLKGISTRYSDSVFAISILKWAILLCEVFVELPVIVPTSCGILRSFFLQCHWKGYSNGCTQRKFWSFHNICSKCWRKTVQYMTQFANDNF